MNTEVPNNIKVIRDLNAINQNSSNKLNSTNKTASNECFLGTVVKVHNRIGKYLPKEIWFGG